MKSRRNNERKQKFWARLKGLLLSIANYRYLLAYSFKKLTITNCSKYFYSAAADNRKQLNWEIKLLSLVSFSFLKDFSLVVLMEILKIFSITL